MLARYAVFLFMMMACVGCGGGGGGGSDTSESLNSETGNQSSENSQGNIQNSGSAGSSPLDSGDGFVFALAELYSNNPLAIVDVAHIAQGETPRLDVLHNGKAHLPYLHSNGTVTVTETCHANDGFGIVEYRRIAALTADGGTNPLTPCSDKIATASGFTWIESGKLSPNGQRLAAQLVTPGEPPSSIVFEGGQEIARYSGFDDPDWIDDDTLIMVGSKLVTARLGEEPKSINDEVNSLSIRNVDVSPDGTRLVFEWNSGLWIMNVNGTGLRELLPQNRYIFPTWSPDGVWVATIQQQAPTALDAQLVGSGAVGIDFEYTNLQQLTVVNVESGEQRIADLSIYLADSQMPQGGLSWY